MVGAPEETREMMEESLRMAQRSFADEIFFSLLYPLPGTQIQQVCEQEQTIKRIPGEQIGPIDHTKYVSSSDLHRFMRKVQHWQIQRYLHDGFTLRGPLFIIDCLRFLFLYKQKYDFEENQLFRWNVQRYKLRQIDKEWSGPVGI
jgi:hypothetical protein